MHFHNNNYFNNHNNYTIMSTASLFRYPSIWQAHCRDNLMACEFFNWYGPSRHCYLLAACDQVTDCSCCVRSVTTTG